MSPVSSPKSGFRELLSRRNLASIPKDQQALLECPNSWAVELKNTPHGLSNLPAHVCQTTKEAYIARASVTQETQFRSSIRSSPKGSSPAVSKNGPTHNHFPQTQNGDRSSPPSSSPERPISWASSPERPLPPQMAVESSIVRETPKAPMGPPPRPAVLSSFPSSDGPEEDLEMELPQAQTHQDAPVNRAAARLQATVASPIPSGDRNMDTPPCAQPSHPTPPVIPNTADAQQPDSPTAQHAPPPEQRRERRMKAIHFGDRTPKKNQYGKSRLAPTKTFAHIPSSISTSPSSVIPATFDEPRTPGFVLQSVENTKDLDMNDQNDTAEDNDIEAIVEESQTQAPVPKSRHSQQAAQDIHQSLAKILVGDAQPYGVFKTTYPDYEERCKGSLLDFVKACYILDYLQKRRGLRECLYDDFIRAIPAYFSYVGNAGSGQEALLAIEWFNNLSGPPTFDRMVITRENIGYVLGCYANEVANLRQMITRTAEEEGTKDLPSVADLSEESEDEVVEGPPTTVHIDGAMEIDANEPVRQPSSTPPLRSVSRPHLTQAPPPSSPALSSTALPSTFATPDARKRPRTSQYLARLAANAKSNATPRRRTADQRAKLREHFLKRKSVEAQGVRSNSKPGR